MRRRVLISDSDWQLLAFAFGDLREHGYDVLAEASPSKALQLARQWRPHLVVASRRNIGAWDKALADRFTDVFEGAAFLVTVTDDEAAGVWKWVLARGFDVLPKPLLHASELRAATEAALRPKGEKGLTRQDSIGRERGGPGRDTSHRDMA